MKIYNPSLQSADITGSLSLTDSVTGSLLGELTSSLDVKYANLSIFNSFTQSTTTVNDDYNLFSSSINTTIKTKLDLDGIISSSGQLTQSYDGRYTLKTEYDYFYGYVTNSLSVQSGRIDTLDGLVLGKDIVSSSEQISNDISGAFTSVSSSISSDIVSIDSRLDNIEISSSSYELRGGGILSGSVLNYIPLIVSESSQIQLDSVSGFTTFTSSVDSRFDNLEFESGSIRTTLNNFTSSNNDRLVNIENYTSSNDTLNTTQNNRLDHLSTFSGSTNGRLENLETESGSIRTTLNSYSQSNDSRILNLETYTGSNDTINTNQNNRLDFLSSFSGSTNSRLDDIESNTGSYSRTDINNIFTGLQTFNDISVNGTASFAYIESITGSAKVIGDAFVILNNETPAQRYAGITVIDSGSSPSTASFYFDGQLNNWGYEYSSSAGVDYGVAIFGPEYQTKGSPTYLTENRIPRATDNHHLNDSNISDDGTRVQITIPLDVTTSITGSDIRATNGFIGSLTGTATTASYVDYSNIDKKPTLISGSSQINFNEISNISANIVSASSQVNFNELSNISSGIVSSSGQITPLLPVDTISGSSQVQLSSITGTTFSSNAYTFPGDLIVSGTLFLQEGQEKIVTASIATSGSTNYDILSQSVLWHTTNAANNWTLNLRGSPTVTFNNAVAVGKSITVVFMVTNGATPYKQVGLQIDGVSVTPRWQGGAQLSGSANSVDSYTIVVFKTGTGGSSAYSVFESITQFK